MNTTPTVIKAASSADFLAVLPRLFEVNVPESAYIVLFAGARTVTAARIDLPDMTDDELVASWLLQIETIVTEAQSAAVVFHTEQALGDDPRSHPYGSLAYMYREYVRGMLGKHNELRDLLVQGSDGFACFTTDNNPPLQPIEMVTDNPLHQATPQQPTIEEWRKAHPDRTVEAGTKEMVNMTREYYAAGCKQAALTQ